MGGLAHHLESAGIATTQISLVRLHTETMRPPRALWVPFELGRPFGPPDDPDFQRGVVRAALELLTRKDGPVLEDYPHEAPAGAGEAEGWACPISFAREREALSDGAGVTAALREEIARLRTWHDRAIASRGRTTVGVSGVELDDVAALIGAILDGAAPTSPRDDLPLADVLRLGAEDLKAFYIEAAAAQPGEASASQLRHWFWSETAASDALRRLGERLAASDDPLMKITGTVLLVPRAEA